MVPSSNIKCKECKKLFIPRWTRQKFCSRSCSATFNNRNTRRHGKPRGDCKRCGKSLVGSYGKIFCSVQCQNDWQHGNYIQRWLEGKETGAHRHGVSGHVKKWMIKQKGEECWKCGWCEVHPTTGNIPIEINHIDGKHINNRPENLELICPNCHSLTTTYRALNKGNSTR